MGPVLSLGGLFRTALGGHASVGVVGRSIRLDRADRLSALSALEGSWSPTELISVQFMGGPCLGKHRASAAHLVVAQRPDPLFLAHLKLWGSGRGELDGARLAPAVGVGLRRAQRTTAYHGGHRRRDRDRPPRAPPAP
jgi:hypothetical protein